MNFLLTKRIILLFTIAVFGLYILLATVPFMLVAYTESREKSRAEQAYNEQAKLSPEEKAINLAEQYLVTNASTIKPAERLFISYLQRKFDRTKGLNIESLPVGLAEDSPRYPQEINLMARIAYPDKLVDRLPEGEVSEINYTNIYGANCDHMSLPKDFWQKVQQSVNMGGYYATHVVLMFEFMKDNQCSIPPIGMDIKAGAIESVRGLAQDASTPRDLWYESVAFLMLAGRHDLVDADWITRITADQEDNGSWVDPTVRDAIGHTTLLAYWSLLEYKYSDKPGEPIIRRPS